MSSVDIYIFSTSAISRLKVDPQKTLEEGRWSEEVGFLPESCPQRL